MKISPEDVLFYCEKYDISNRIAEEIADILTETWETDYDYDTFMQDGIEMEIERLLEENPDRTDIRKK